MRKRLVGKSKNENYKMIEKRGFKEGIKYVFCYIKGMAVPFRYLALLSKVLVNFAIYPQTDFI
jgi:hypothetical protein